MTTIVHGTAERELAFLRKLQRLLDEGDFSSTYKFALLQALADLAVEHPTNYTGSLVVSLDAIAEKFIEYYWRQAVPYQPDHILSQNAGRPAEVLTHVSRAREKFDGNLTRLRADARAWRRTRSTVAGIVRKMPLWKLQHVAGETDEFLYRRADFVARTIRLLPGVADALRAFHPLVTHLVRGGWVGQVRRIGRNRTLLGKAPDLHEFMFGSERQNLDGYRAVLLSYQSARCFYCGKETRAGEADHFIPWSRYAADLGHNFVYACKPCNLAKRDYLAQIDHLARWREVNLDGGAELTRSFTESGLVHDVKRTEFVASWAYEQAERSGAHGWIAKDRFNRIDDRWRHALFPFPAAAERPIS